MSTQLQRRIPDEWFSFDDCLNFCEAYRDPMIVCAAQSEGRSLPLPPLSAIKTRWTMLMLLLVFYIVLMSMSHLVPILPLSSSTCPTLPLSS